MEEVVRKQNMMTLGLVSTSKSSIDICPTCGEPIGKIVNMIGKTYIVPRMCKCKKEAFERDREHSEAIEKQVRLQQIFNNSLMTKEFKNLNFDKWDHSLANEKMYNLGVKYVKEFKTKAFKNNIGLLIYGNPGNGKTFLSGCIANALMNNFIPVVCVSSIGLLERIKSSFNKYGDQGVESILNCLDNADLVILDDLGTENNTDWSRATIYQIIDSRYRRKKPMIVTTNLSKYQLKKRYDVDNSKELGRTYDRLANEMCQPIENSWSSIRTIKGREKTKILGEILNQ